MSCQHERFVYVVRAGRDQDTGTHAASLKLKCAECGEAFGVTEILRKYSTEAVFAIVPARALQQ